MCARCTQTKTLRCVYYAYNGYVHTMTCTSSKAIFQQYWSVVARYSITEIYMYILTYCVIGIPELDRQMKLFKLIIDILKRMWIPMSVWLLIVFSPRSYHLGFLMELWDNFFVGIFFVHIKCFHINQLKQICFVETGNLQAEFYFLLFLNNSKTLWRTPPIYFLRRRIQRTAIKDLTLLT